MKRRIPLAPEEGWLTLGLVLLMCLTLAWSVDGVRWVLGQDEYLDYLVLAATGGVLAGFVGPKVGWNRWLTYLIGCIFAALIVPLLTGLIDAPEGASLRELYTATAYAAVRAFIDLGLHGDRSTLQYLHHALVFGLIVWATSMFASYAVFGHRRALNAVVVVGVVLVGNMTFARDSQLPLLVLFSLASLFLLTRAHVFDEQSEWLRRRIGDPGSISTVYLRGGTAFIALTVAAAFLLTQVASSAPLAGAWVGLGDRLISLTSSFSRFLPTGGDTRPFGLSFGSNSVVSGVWSQEPGTALTIRRSPVDDGDYYWRVVTYDQADLGSWSYDEMTTVVRPANSIVLEGLADVVDEPGLHAFAFTVIPVGYTEPFMVSPRTPALVSETVRLGYVGEGGFFTRMERDGRSGQYDIAAQVPVPGNQPGQLNTTALRATSTAYPTEVLTRFAAKPPAGSLGPEALKLEAKILAAAGGSRAPVDIANALVTELRSSTYAYDPDVRDLPCRGLSTVECFATHKRGYCQYYARTMATILRNQGIPTRLVEGFLPGPRQAGIETILSSSAHEWVEVYFMDYGWVLFDPTGGNLEGQVGPLPSGPPIASGSPRPSASGPTATIRLPIDDDTKVPPSAGGALSPSSVGPLVAVTVLLLLVTGGLAFAVWQRGPRGATTADAAYGMVTRIASRFGFGPRPAQTVYEYAGTLGEVLPDVRPELETVARAKVESVYGRQVLGAERVEGLRTAQRRLRVALLRLIVRRRERRRRRR